MARTPPPPPMPGTLRMRLMNTMTDAHVGLYRRSGGRLGGSMMGAKIILVDHVGAKSGKHRTTPLMYISDGDDLVIVASRGGSPVNPAWFHNLMANPATTVQIGQERRNVLARRATAEEKQRLWPRVVDAYSGYAEYEQRTDRDIPLVVLEPAP